MPLFWLSLAFLVGILLGSLLKFSTTGWLVLVAVALTFGLVPGLGRYLLINAPGLVRGPVSWLPFVLVRVWVRGLGVWERVKPPLPVSIVIFTLALGGARYQSVQPDLSNPNFIASYNDGEGAYVVEVIVVKPPDIRDSYTNLTMEAERFREESGRLYEPVEGRILAQVPPGGDWRYGDRLSVRGRLETPPEWEAFSYRDYLARQGVYTYIRKARVDLLQHDQGNRFLAAIYALRRRALAQVYQLYPDPEASLLAGILLGVESGIPESVQQAFRDTGTAHIIAISGFNITILAGLFFVLASRLFGRWWGALVAILGVALYTLLVGSGPPVLRAAIMGGLSLFARQVGRRQDGLNTLFFVAALMALFDPDILWDVGFQLSFMATLGLLLYGDPLIEAFTRFAARYTSPENAHRLAGPVGAFILITLAAQLTTLPVVAYHFRRISLSSLVTNPAILPAQPAVMVLGGLAVVLGLIYQPLGQLAAYLAWPFVVYTIRVVEWFANLPGGVLVLGSVTLVWIALFYIVLFGWTFAGPRLRAWFSARVNLESNNQVMPSALFGALLVALAVLAILVWREALSLPDGRLYLTVLDVGSGDALLIQSPSGGYVLVDGGSSASRLSDALGRRLPLTHRRLDYLVVAAPGEDNLAALPAVMERFPAEQVLWAGPTHGNRAARDLREHLAQNGFGLNRAETGQVLELGEGARLIILAAGERGAVLLLEWNKFQALLPLGIDFESLERLQNEREPGQVTALLLAESGYAPANPPQWIRDLNPQVILLSVAAGDWQGLPSPETLQAIQGYNLLRTDRNGWIQLSTDGEQLWLEVERK